MTVETGRLPSLDQAEAYLEEAGSLNPGPWVDHSRHVAQAARILAQAMRLGDPRHADLDPQRAYILGLLHDIGRREGVHGMRHVVDGYRFLVSEGYPAAGRISLTHSYPDKDLIQGASGWDGKPEELAFVRQYIAGIDYDIYDRLVQLCDAICMPHGFVLMEKRMVDVALRYGLGSDAPIDRLARRWKAFFGIQTELEALIGGSIYAHLPGVVENTFGFQTFSR
jgi:hypothetical protein